ncbi:MAG: PAS domain-containing protein, partial [Verrucomicrobiaceae bacterium]
MIPRSDVRESTAKRSNPLVGHLKMLAENAPVAMAIFDTQMSYIYANPRWLEVFRLEKTDISGRSQYELFPSLHPGWRHVYERALSGQIVRSDRDTVNQAGVPVLYRWEVRPWRHADSSIGGVMISCLSIVGLKTKDLADGATDLTQGGAVVESGGGLWAMPLPVVALDAAGRVCRSGAGATPLFLSAGLTEGETFFWQLFGEDADGGELCADTRAALHEVLSGRRNGLVVSLNPSTFHAGSGIPSTWHLTRLPGGAHDFAEDVVLCIGLHLSDGQSIGTPAGGAADESAAMDELARIRMALKESVESEKNVRQREVRLRAVLDAAPCGLLVIDE